jgi:hypothetical protein
MFCIQACSRSNFPALFLFFSSQAHLSFLFIIQTHRCCFLPFFSLPHITAHILHVRLLLRHHLHDSWSWLLVLALALGSCSWLLALGLGSWLCLLVLALGLSSCSWLLFLVLALAWLLTLGSWSYSSFLLLAHALALQNI